MHDWNSRQYAKNWGWWIVIVASICAALGAVIYLFRLGSTEKWAETSCTVVGSRVVREATYADSSRAIIMYKGEYRVRYIVEGQEYYIWAFSGWSDVEKEFVQAKVGYLPDQCNFRIRYNPLHPSEAFQVPKVQP